MMRGCFLLIALIGLYLSGSYALLALRSVLTYNGAMMFKSSRRSGDSSNSHVRLWQSSGENKETSTYSSIHPSGGKLSLVGSGPGDPELLTVQALRLIKEADVVVSDRLVSPEIMDLVQCKLLVAKKMPGCAEMAQEQIYQWVCDAVKAGDSVVRLKIGDPLLFGRGGEEILRFREELNIEPFVSAGVSSSYSAPLAANIPLTHRGVSNQVLISTGYGRDGSRVSIPPYSEDRTVVLLMAVGRIGEIAGNMMEQGYKRQTPVAIIERATTPKQRTLVGTLENIGEIAKSEKARAPACIVVGHVVDVLHN